MAIEHVLSTPKARKALEEVLQDSNHKHYASVLKTLSGYVVPKLLRVEGTGVAPVMLYLPENGRTAPKKEDDTHGHV
jgi:hypothetical protein